MQLTNLYLQKDQQRRRVTVVPKPNWIRRNPRAFQILFITGSLLVFFSKPLYDIFIADPLPPSDIPASKRLR